MVPSSRSPRVKRYVGENGVTVLHEDNLSSRALCIGVWVKTGSRDEAAGEQGLERIDAPGRDLDVRIVLFRVNCFALRKNARSTRGECLEVGHDLLGYGR